MIAAAAARVRDAHLESHPRLALASMHELPFAARSVDFIVAHGIWNLARSGSEFRLALAEAARVARPERHVRVHILSEYPAAGRAAGLERSSRTSTPPRDMPNVRTNYVAT